MDLLKELSFLVMKSGGHPRRVSTLLRKLFEIEFEIDYVMYNNYRENYATSKLAELKDKGLESQMDLEFRFETDDSFVKESFANSAKNDALKNMVQPFIFSSLARQNAGKKTKLILNPGNGSYVPALGKTEIFGFLFIPYPVLEKGQKKIPFFKSLIDYFGAKEVNRGKNLEICVCDALNFMLKIKKL